MVAVANQNIVNGIKKNSFCDNIQQIINVIC